MATLFLPPTFTPRSKAAYLGMSPPTAVALAGWPAVCALGTALAFAEGPRAPPAARVRRTGQIGTGRTGGPLAGRPPVGGLLVGQRRHRSLDPRREGAGVFTLIRPQRCAERDGRARRRDRLAVALEDAAGALQVHGYDRLAVPDAEEGGAALVGLAPAMWAASALGEDDDAPALVQQAPRQASAAGTHPVA